MYSISKKITYGQLIGEINFPLFGYLYYIFNICTSEYVPLFLLDRIFRPQIYIFIKSIVFVVKKSDRKVLFFSTFICHIREVKIFDLTENLTFLSFAYTYELYVYICGHKM